MIDWKQDLAILSDLSANIFAVFILVLIMLLLQPPQADDRPQPSPVIEATSDLAIVERAPLPAASVIVHLFDRRASAEGESIDQLADLHNEVHNSEEVMLRIAGDQPVAQRLGAILKASPATAPVRLYVFDNRKYVLVTDALAGGGRTFREISVPQALRGRSGAGSADAWSTAFLQLIARPLDPSRFRYALARLLEGAGEGGFEAAKASQAAAPAESAPSMTDRLRQFAARLGTIFALVMIVTAIVVVLLIEWRWPRSRQFLHRS